MTVNSRLKQNNVPVASNVWKCRREVQTTARLLAVETRKWTKLVTCYLIRLKLCKTVQCTDRTTNRILLLLLFFCFFVSSSVSFFVSLCVFFCDVLSEIVDAFLFIDTARVREEIVFDRHSKHYLIILTCRIKGSKQTETRWRTHSTIRTKTQWNPSGHNTECIWIPAWDHIFSDIGHYRRVLNHIFLTSVIVAGC